MTMTMLAAALAVLTIDLKPGEDIGAAVARARKERQTGERAEIVFADGVHTWETEIVLGAADSNFTFRAAHPGKARIVPGVAFTGADFRPIRDTALLGRLDPAVRGKALAWEVPAAARTNFFPNALSCFTGLFQYYAYEYRSGWLATHQLNRVSKMPLLTVGEREMQIARYPNVGDWLWPEKEDYAGVSARSNRLIRVAGNCPGKWKWNGADVYAHGYLRGCGYAPDHMRVLGWDAASNAVEFAAKKIAQGSRYYFLNVLEEIDAPGEWCYDSASGCIVLYPPEGFGKATPCSLATFRGHLLDMNAEGTEVKGLVFAGKCTHAPIRGEKSVGATIEGCSFFGIEHYAIYLNGRRNAIRNCDFRDVHAGAVVIKGGSAKADAPGSNVVENCRFERICTLRTGCSSGAVSLMGYGNAVRHCELHDIDEIGILNTGAGNLIEYNRLYDISREFSDSAAVYAIGHVDVYGTVIRYNDVGGSPGYSNGIYLDNMSSGCEVYGNIVRNYGHYGIFCGGGRDNVISNNIVTAGWGGIYTDNRGLFWPDQVVRTNTFDTLEKRHGIATGPFGRRYPRIADWYRDDGKLAHAPMGNVWANNLFLDLFGSASTLFIAMKRDFPRDRNLFRGNLAVRTRGLGKGEYDVISGDTKNAPTNEWSSSTAKCFGALIPAIRVLDGTAENPIDLGFREVPPAQWNATDYMYVEQGWVNIPKLTALKKARAFSTSFRKGDFSLSPYARIYREIPGWQPIPWDEIGLRQEDRR